jgi:hypothetical protein
VDIVINNLDGPPTVLRNTSQFDNQWLIIKCVGTKSNRSAIGARITVVAGEHRQIGEVMSGGSYYSHNDLRLHFGLGDRQKADTIEIAWPSGQKDALSNVPANQIITIQEGKGLADPNAIRPSRR